METEVYSRDKNGFRVDYTNQSPRFSVLNDQTLDEGINYMNENGYVVLSDVMSSDEVRGSLDLLWDFLETIPDRHIQRDTPDTWSNRWPGLSSSGVVNECGIGQSDFMWHIRGHPNVKRIYSRIWNTNELLVSFDGCGIFRDWRYNPLWKTTGGWYHVDQNPVQKPDRCCVQGFLSLTDQNETTGGLVVLPQSHLRFRHLDDLGRRPKDFIMIPKQHRIFDNGRAICRLVQCRAGDFVLWDSRLIHCNSPAFVDEDRRETDSVELLRVVAYVSMSPTSFIPGNALEKFRKQRRAAVRNNCTLTHWSTEIVEAKSSHNLPKVPFEKLNPQQRALVIGVEPQNDDDE